ncbi:glycoside hydrolase family 1 protein [Oidiodendron maius Zn]|uniref:Glycoside hydrolase family 1 protein n=1 Tax=Oidiodendron maius (strain Zn) TaxID=913774 RepID=A0A0C3GWT5_OIDMZ|nr:glycoside hydrolase family 1 protein [Oidiodendron maius Zn]
MTTVRYATPLSSSPPITTYMPSASMSAIVPSGVQTTTWAKNLPDASDWENPYGQAEWNVRWEQFTAIATASISTTVQPDPVPSTSLILPPDHGFSFGNDKAANLSFPPGFIFGAASSAPQIEGAIQDEGRTPSIQDFLFYNRNDMPDYITDWSYYLYKDDIARMAAIGVPYYSFSISWSRILPFAATGTPVNQEGIDHYNDVINTCLQYGIQPMVTMLHGDVPNEFLLGYDNTIPTYFSPYTGNTGVVNATFVDSFVYYAQILFSQYGDRVPLWITVNEPYGDSVNLHGMYNFLDAHTQVYDLYKSMGGLGMVSYKNADDFGVPLDPTNQSHIDAANRYQDYLLGIISNPLFLGEDVPESVSSTCTNESVPLSPSQLAAYKGKCDFYAIDPYTAIFITPPPEGIDACASDPGNSQWPTCVNTGTVSNNGWNIGLHSNDYPYLTPTYFRAFMNYIWQTYNPPAIMVTEFGFPVLDEAGMSSLDDQRYDLSRSLYYESYLTEILNCIHEDGINIIGAIGWSALDNWEFGTFDQRFGMQTVDRDTMERTYKRSFFDFVNFFHSHGL